jgi:rubrerythrin
MRCARCDGLMVREQFEDLRALGSSDHEYAGWRCINCGAIVDAVIAARRCPTSQAVASNPALTTV